MIIPEDTNPIQPTSEAEGVIQNEVQTIEKRGNLIVYDLEGMIVSQTGEASGTLLPHVYPVGIPYLELPFGDMKYASQRLVRIDVSSNPHKPVFEAIVIAKTIEEELAEARAKLKAAGIE